MSRYCEPCEYAGKTTEATTSYMSPIAGLTLCCDPCRKANAPIAAALELDPKRFAVEKNFKAAGTSSRAAYSAAQDAIKGKTHQKIFDALQTRPMISDEVARVTGIHLLTVRPRINDLKNDGWILPTGEERNTDAGKAAAVYRTITNEERAVWLAKTQEAA